MVDPNLDRLKRFAEADAGWERALAELGLDTLEIGNVVEAEPSPFGIAALRLVESAGLSVEAYCRRLAEPVVRAWLSGSVGIGVRKLAERLIESWRGKP